jgi:V/A-type H+/Na+-transporting ATPase subunit E
MDVQLQELIDKIKAEGVEEARVQAERLIDDAKQQADAILAEATEKAEKLISNAESEAEKALRTGKEAIGQAARDLLLGVSRQIEKLFTQVIEIETGTALSVDVLERAILNVFDAIGDDTLEGASLTLSEADANALTDGLRAKLAEKVKSGVIITPSSKISAGFQVSVDEGAAYYSFTPKEVADVLASFLNPRLAAILKDSIEE